MRRGLRRVPWLALLAGMAGCGSDVAPTASGTAGPASAAPSGVSGGTESADAGPAQADASPLAAMELREADFIETEGESRDPFRNYAKAFVNAPAGRGGSSRVPVLLPQVPIEELRLIAIVSGVGTPRAMVLDQSGVGTVVRRGDYVGRGDVVRGGPDGASEFEINWRVSKILTDGIVLVREDPTSPGRAPLTRMIAMHPEGRPGLPGVSGR